MSSSFQSLKAFVTPSLAKDLSSAQKPEYFKQGVAYIYIYIYMGMNMDLGPFGGRS